MEDRLQALERAWHEVPGDAERALDLARACLRAGRVLRALTISRPWSDAGVRVGAAEELARRRGLVFAGVELGFERFLAGEDELVLVPGGAFLDDGPGAWSSSLLPSGSRAGLRRVELADFLIAIAARSADLQPHAAQLAAQVGGRLATAEEWKKAWRGGLFLDGDETAQSPNPSPDRVAPWGFEPEPEGAAVSPYGLVLERGACEWCERSALGLILDAPNGRYHVPVGTSAQRRGRELVFRVVVDP
jgi:hypothetical protein